MGKGNMFTFIKFVTGIPTTRQIMTKADVNHGATLFVEPPKCFIVRQEFICARCSFCLKRLDDYFT